MPSPTPTPTPEEKTAAGRLLRALELFQVMDSDVPAAEIIVFLIIAIGEERDTALSVTETSRRAGLKLSTTSRYMQNLSATNRHAQPGKELVKAIIDPMNASHKIIRLTPKGRLVARQLRETISGA